MGKLSGVRCAATLEVALISLVMLCLPLFEAPKNFFSVLFLVVWVYFGVRASGLGLNSPFDLPIAGLAGILWVAPLFSEFSSTITVLNSAPRWTLLALFVLASSRLDYSRGQILAIIAALMVGGIAAVAESFWQWSLNQKPYPEFRSVGHVNHSSMYSLIPLAAGIGALYFRERIIQALGFTAILSTVAFVPPSKSLVGGATVAIILILAVGSYAMHRGSIRNLILAVCALVVVLSVALAVPVSSGFRSELVMRVTGDDIFSQRDTILNSALAVWDRHPVLGTGFSSFGVVTSEQQVRFALVENGLEYDPSDYEHYPHGHNLWTTILIERGVLGIVLVTGLLLIYFRTFVPLVMSREQTEPGDRGVAVAALLVALGFAVGGLGNTTMMNEHGHAGMALIAVCYGYLRAKGLLSHG